jgi:hypothetical protein
MPPVRVTGTKDKNPNPKIKQNPTAGIDMAHTADDKVAPTASKVTVTPQLI